MRIKIKTLKIISLVVSVVLVITTVAIIPFVINTTPKQTEHKYATGIVTNKYFTEGYGSVYYYVPPDFVIVSEIEINDETYSYTHHVSDTIYNSYNVGDEIRFCHEHNKLLEYE